MSLELIMFSNYLHFMPLYSKVTKFHLHFLHKKISKFLQIKIYRNLDTL